MCEIEKNIVPIQGATCFTIHSHLICEEHHFGSYGIIHPKNNPNKNKFGDICQNLIHENQEFLANEEKLRFHVTFYGESDVPLKEISFNEYQKLFNEKFSNFGLPSTTTYENLQKFLDDKTKCQVVNVYTETCPKRGYGIVFGIKMAGKIYYKFMKKYEYKEDDSDKEKFLQKVKEMYENSRFDMSDAKIAGNIEPPVDINLKLLKMCILL